jgi:hypothetical protein
VELTCWQQLSDWGPDLILCLDSADEPAPFAALATSALVDSCFLHIGQSGSGEEPLDIERWVREVLDTGRPVRAVLGHGAGAALATSVADAIAAAVPAPPAVLLFDATAVTGSTPLFLSSRDHELPAEHPRNISLDVDRAGLLRDPEVIKLVADLLNGEHSW